MICGLYGSTREGLERRARAALAAGLKKKGRYPTIGDGLTPISTAIYGSAVSPVSTAAAWLCAAAFFAESWKRCKVQKTSSTMIGMSTQGQIA